MAERKEIVELVRAALQAQKRSYSPYSRFAVGAALRASGRSGRIFTGCNVENSSYGGTICAERVAAGKAISEGCRKFTCIAIATPIAEPAPPCGLCLQFLAEFCDDLEVVLVSSKTKKTVGTTLRALMPVIFRLR